MSPPRRLGILGRIAGIRVVSPAQPVSVVVTRSGVHPPEGVTQDFVAAEAWIRDGDYVVAAKLSIRNNTSSTQATVKCELIVGEHRDEHFLVFNEGEGGSVAVPLLAGAHVSGPVKALVQIDVLTPGAFIEVNNVVLAAMRVDQVVLA